MARNGSGDFEEIQVNSNANHEGVASPMSSLAEALASAAATEHDHRRRKILVQNMARVLFETLEPGAEGTAGSQWTKEQSNRISQQILGEEQTGSTTIANSFSSVTPTTKITFNQDNPLKLLWSWQISQGSDGTTEYSTCYLSIFAKDGVKIDFFSPSTTPQTEEDALKIAVCDASNFQWTLEGTTKKESDGGEGFEDIQSFWKLESSSFSWLSGSIGDIPAEESLLEGTDISLTGKIINSTSNGDLLQLQPKSVLSLKMSSVGSLGLSNKEIRRVGMALRALVNFLDKIIHVPELHLSLTDVSEGASRPGRPEEEAKPPSGDEEIMTLGGVMKYYLKHFCNESDRNKDGSANQTPKFLSMGLPISDAVSAAALAMKDSVAAAKSRTNLAESKERYAAVAGEAVEAATTASKKIAGSFWGSVESLTAGRKNEQEQQQESEGTDAHATSTTTNNNNNNNSSNAAFRFGDNFRKVVARGKEATDRIVANSGQQGEGFRIGGFSRGLFASARSNIAESSPPNQQEQPPLEQQQTL